MVVQLIYCRHDVELAVVWFTAQCQPNDAAELVHAELADGLVVVDGKQQFRFYSAWTSNQQQ